MSNIKNRFQKTSFVEKVKGRSLLLSRVPSAFQLTNLAHCQQQKLSLLELDDASIARLARGEAAKHKCHQTVQGHSRVKAQEVKERCPQAWKDPAPRQMREMIFLFG